MVPISQSIHPSHILLQYGILFLVVIFNNELIQINSTWMCMYLPMVNTVHMKS